MSPRDRILQRRAKFVAAALASTAVACSSSSTSNPEVCLEPAFDSGSDTGTPDAQPEVCLSPALDSSVSDSDTGPMPCLDPAVDTGVMDAQDTGPEPCLKMPLDSGSD